MTRHLTVLFILSLILPGCSDDTTGEVDAQAACNCPAEPPLAGRIIQVEATNPVAADSSAIHGANCPAGGTVLGGGCKPQTPSNQMVLEQFGPDPVIASFFCAYNNTSTVNANAIVTTAICLVPPE